MTRVHTLDGDGDPLCMWTNLPDPSCPHRVRDLHYCGACLLVQLYTGVVVPGSTNEMPWLALGCRRPDQRPWEAYAMLAETGWVSSFRLRDLPDAVVAEQWWFQ